MNRRRTVEHFNSHILLREASSALSRSRLINLDAVISDLRESVAEPNPSNITVFFDEFCEGLIWNTMRGVEITGLVASLDTASLTPSLERGISHLLDKKKYLPVSCSEELLDNVLSLSTFLPNSGWPTSWMLNTFRLKTECCSPEFQALALDAGASHEAERNVNRSDVIAEYRFCILLRKAYQGNWTDVVTQSNSYPAMDFDPKARLDWVSGCNALASAARWLISDEPEQKKEAIFWISMNEIRWALARFRLIDALPLPIARFCLLQWLIHSALKSGRIVNGRFELSVVDAFDQIDLFRPQF